MRFISVFIFLLLLSGCFSNIDNLEQGDGEKLAGEVGYLMIAVDTNMPLKSILITGEKNLRLTSVDLKRGTNFIITEVPSGKYRINRINTIDGWYLKPKKEYFEFEVASKSISYVGHLRSRSGFFVSTYIDIENKSVDALVYLEENFPDLVAKNKLVYRGPGEDQFLKRMQEQQVGVEK